MQSAMIQMMIFMEMHLYNGLHMFIMAANLSEIKRWDLDPHCYIEIDTLQSNNVFSFVKFK